MTPRGLTACVLLSGLLSAGQAAAASNLLIWPIDPFFAPEDNAAELWLQNQGDQATTMQVRIVRWRQENGNERYEQQQEVVASPPIVRVEGGTKQLIRLIKQTTVPAGIEQAYRIVVDEIPQPDGSNNPQIGLKLQMRYSIPLFVYGQGIATQRSGTHHAFVNPADLSWRVVNEGGQRAVQVTNRGGYSRPAEQRQRHAVRSASRDGAGAAGVCAAPQHARVSAAGWHAESKPAHGLYQCA